MSDRYAPPRDEAPLRDRITALRAKKFSDKGIAKLLGVPVDLVRAVLGLDGNAYDDLLKPKARDERKRAYHCTRRTTIDVAKARRLIEVEGWRHKDVAEHLGCHETSLSRALAAAREREAAE